MSSIQIDGQYLTAGSSCQDHNVSVHPTVDEGNPLQMWLFEQSDFSPYAFHVSSVGRAGCVAQFLKEFGPPCTDYTLSSYDFTKNRVSLWWEQEQDLNNFCNGSQEGHSQKRKIFAGRFRVVSGAPVHINARISKEEFFGPGTR